MSKLSVMAYTLNPGDLVRFIDDVGEGRVVRVLKSGMVEIRTTDGWDMPVPASRLVYIPEEKPERSGFVNIQVPDKPSMTSIPVDAEPAKVQNTKGTGVFLAVTQMVDSAGEFSGIQLQLLNDLGASFRAVVFERYENEAKVVVEDVVESGLLLMLDTYPLERLSEIKGFTIQGILIPEKNGNPMKPVDFHLLFQAKKFASPGSYRTNDLLDEPAQLFRLDDSSDDRAELAEKIEQLIQQDIAKVLIDKESKQKPRVKQETSNRLPIEVDLHINKLMDSVVGLSNSQILSIQMAKFREELDAAIIDNESEIIFIHGVGNGTLKSELRKVVEEDYTFCHYQDASFREYGFGATRVLIRQNKK